MDKGGVNATPMADIGGSGRSPCGSACTRQEVSAPLFEIGGNVSGIVAFGFDDGGAVVGGGGPRVTVNVTPRLAIDLSAEVIGPTE
jgi:hypothetical protein